MPQGSQVACPWEYAFGVCRPWGCAVDMRRAQRHVLAKIMGPSTARDGFALGGRSSSLPDNYDGCAGHMRKPTARMTFAMPRFVGASRNVLSRPVGSEVLPPHQPGAQPRSQPYFLEEEDRTGTLACLSFNICCSFLLMR